MAKGARSHPTIHALSSLELLFEGNLYTVFMGVDKEPTQAALGMQEFISRTEGSIVELR